MTALVTFDHVSKRYRKGRERINLRAALPGRWGELQHGDFHWALNDLSFTLNAGDSLGFIGPNGAGKSTTLKLVAGVIAPTSGSVTVNGRTASLIELGAGFHPDMTGRENLFFSAAVLGMGPRAIHRRFDEIVDFADIGSYLDTPVKRYSSGMMARLGFAVATHLDAEVLVLDEVLAVGDANFQRKCHQRIGQLTKDGIALLYVTHAIWTVPMLCQQAILLAAGSVCSRGAPVDVARDYERLQQSGALPSGSSETNTIRALTASTAQIAPGGRVEIDLRLQLGEAAPAGVALVFLVDEQLKVFSQVSTRDHGVTFDRAGGYHLVCEIDSLPLQPGNYNIYCAFAADHHIPAIDDVKSVAVRVVGDEVDPSGGVIRLPARWTVRSSDGLAGRSAVVPLDEPDDVG